MSESANLSDLAKVNPLLDENDSSRVESVLSLLSFLLLDAAKDGLTLTDDQAHGLACTIDCCCAALEILRVGEVRHA